MKVCQILCMSKLGHSISFTGVGVSNRPDVYGDMVLTPEQEDEFFTDHSEPSLVQGFRIHNSTKKWPHSIVPYVLHPALSELENLLNVS